MFLIFCLFLAFDELVCIVDREAITKEEIGYISLFYPGVGYEDIIEKVINNKIIEYLAQEETLTVSKEEISQMKDEIIANNSGVASLLSNDYVNKLYDEQLQAQILTNKLISTKFRQRLRVSPAEIQKFYRNHRDSLMIPELITLERLQVPVYPSDDNPTLKEAKKILSKYKKGADFASLAKKYSDDFASIPYGGRLGTFSAEDIPPHLAGVLDLKEGEAEIFESPTGYHIIKLDSREGINLSISQIQLEFKFKEEDIKSAENRALQIKREWLSEEDTTFSYKTELIGPLPVQTITPALIALTDTMKIGQISDPILEGANFHLLRLKEREKNRIPEFSEIKDRLSNVIMQQKMMNMIDEWLEKEKNHIFIKRI